MIRETITFKFADEAQRSRFYDKLNTHCRCDSMQDEDLPERLQSALLLWLNMESAENVSRLRAATLEYFGSEGVAEE